MEGMHFGDPGAPFEMEFGEGGIVHVQTNDSEWNREESRVYPCPRASIHLPSYKLHKYLDKMSHRARVGGRLSYLRRRHLILSRFLIEMR
jgi:hypothetical protein